MTPGYHRPTCVALQVAVAVMRKGLEEWVVFQEAYVSLLLLAPISGHCIAIA